MKSIHRSESWLLSLQIFEELKHPHDLNCVLHWRGHTTDVFVTYFPGSIHVWSTYLLASGELEIKLFAYVWWYTVYLLCLFFFI